MKAYIKVHEWDKSRNCEGAVAVWGNDPTQYSQEVCDIVNEIMVNGFAVRGDSVYTDENEEEAEW